MHQRLTGSRLLFDRESVTVAYDEGPAIPIALPPVPLDDLVDFAMTVGRGTERRRAFRVFIDDHVKLDVRYRCREDQDCRAATARNISTSGIQLRIEDDSRIGPESTLELTLEFEGEITAHVIGNVRWRENDHVGVQFDRSSDEDAHDELDTIIAMIQRDWVRDQLASIRD